MSTKDKIQIHRLFGVLSSPERLRILEYLSKVGESSYSDTLKNIAVGSEKSEPKAFNGYFAYHMRPLKRMGLIELDHVKGSYSLTRNGTMVWAIIRMMLSGAVGMDPLFLEATDAIHEEMDRLRDVLNELETKTAKPEPLFIMPQVSDVIERRDRHREKLGRGPIRRKQLTQDVEELPMEEQLKLIRH